jgi:hypothetical protein
MYPLFLRLVRPPSGAMETLKSGIIFSAESMRRATGLHPTTSYVTGKGCILINSDGCAAPEVGQTSQYKRAVGTSRTDELITSGCPLFGRDFGRQVAAPLT